MNCNLNPAHDDRDIPIENVEWIARIVWASQWPSSPCSSACIAPRCGGTDRSAGAREQRLWRTRNHARTKHRPRGRLKDAAGRPVGPIRRRVVPRPAEYPRPPPSRVLVVERGFRRRAGRRWPLPHLRRHCDRGAVGRASRSRALFERRRTPTWPGGVGRFDPGLSLCPMYYAETGFIVPDAASTKFAFHL